MRMTLMLLSLTYEFEGSGFGTAGLNDNGTWKLNCGVLPTAFDIVSLKPLPIQVQLQSTPISWPRFLFHFIAHVFCFQACPCDHIFISATYCHLSRPSTGNALEHC